MLIRLILICTIAAVVSALEKTICESKLDTLGCPTGLIVQVDDVLYGRTQSNICNPFFTNIQNLHCRSTQVSTTSVISNCNARTTCLVQADNNFLGEDPCPNVPKYLHIKYRCVLTIGPAVISTPSTPSTTPATTPTTITMTTTPLTTTQGSNIGVLNTGSSSRSNQSGGIQCHEYLVSGPRGVPDSQLSASSRLSLSNNAHRARLYMQIDKRSSSFTLEGGWTADPTDNKPWVQVKMNWPTLLTGISTQGRHVNPATSCCQEWTTKYMVEYSIDGQNWETIKDSNGQPKEFVGNTDTDTVISYMFDCPVVARFVRVQVITYHGSPSMRLELLGCPSNTGDLGKCPKGWKERPSSGTCYYISGQNDQKSWENAMLTCKRQQGEFVKIDSVQEKAWLQQELSNLQQKQKANVWWIGLNNQPRFDNKNYHWDDGTSFNSNILQWNPSQPDNAGGKEHCGVYILSSDKVNDLDCGQSFPFICEMKKYWLPPVNKPGLVTLKPTVPTTIAPTTGAHKIPIPIGGGSNVVNTGLNTFTTGCLKPTDCGGRAWANYPSCHGCGFYMTCAPNGVFVRPCPLGLKYDANLNACWQTSSTCHGP